MSQYLTYKEDKTTHNIYIKSNIIQFIKMKTDLNLDILLNIVEKDIMTLELVIILFL